MPQLELYKLILKSVGIFLFALVFFAAGSYVTHQRDSKILLAQVAADQSKLDSVISSYNVAIEKANGEAALQTEKLRTEIVALTNDLKAKEDELAKRKNELLHKSKITVSSDGKRSTGGLSLTGAVCDKNGSSPTVNLQAGGNTGTAAGIGNEAQCRLNESTATALITIAADGDSAVNQLNEVINAYNRVRVQGCGPSDVSVTVEKPTTPNR